MADLLADPATSKRYNMFKNHINNNLLINLEDFTDQQRKTKRLQVLTLSVAGHPRQAEKGKENLTARDTNVGLDWTGSQVSLFVELAAFHLKETKQSWETDRETEQQNEWQGNILQGCKGLIKDLNE